MEKNKIVILDEATSNVDFETDEMIQKVIKEKFEDCIVINIAHRLNTIINYDRILVIDKGEIVEQGTPSNLYKRNGLFTELVKSNKEVEQRFFH